MKDGKGLLKGLRGGAIRRAPGDISPCVGGVLTFPATTACAKQTHRDRPIRLIVFEPVRTVQTVTLCTVRDTSCTLRRGACTEVSIGCGGLKGSRDRCTMSLRISSVLLHA